MKQQNTKIGFERLNLKNPDQIAFMYKVRTHPKVDSLLLGSAPKNFLQHTNYLFGAVSHNAFFLLKSFDDDCYVGYMQMSLSLEDHTEVGWALHPDFWGKKLGTNAVEETLCLLRNWLPRGQKIMLKVMKVNLRAKSIYDKLGFKVIAESQTLARSVIKMEKINE